MLRLAAEFGLVSLGNQPSRVEFIWVHFLISGWRESSSFGWWSGIGQSGHWSKDRSAPVAGRQLRPGSTKDEV
jgi:hypothetical protein